MNVLCFSDLHRDVQAARALVEASAAVDLVIGAGDFANRHQGLNDTLEILSEIKKPAVLVPGNGETFEELCEAAAPWESAQVLHGSGCVIGGVSFWGVGGGIPVTPFGQWSYDFDESQAADLLAGCPDEGVLVVHSPPIDTVDHDTNGKIRGSRAIRNAIEAKRLSLVACGHIHSDWQKQVLLAETRIVNAGPQGCQLQI